MYKRQIKEGRGGDPRGWFTPYVRNLETHPDCRTDLIGGAATQTFAPGGKHPRVATVPSLQNYMNMTIKSSKSKPDVEFPYGVPLFSKCGSGSISAVDRDRKTGNIKCKKLPFYYKV